MLLFAYILIISTRIFKILTFFYHVIILLRTHVLETDWDIKKCPGVYISHMRQFKQVGEGQGGGMDYGNEKWLK
jgi:hypothetical protein